VNSLYQWVVVGVMILMSLSGCEFYQHKPIDLSNMNLTTEIDFDRIPDNFEGIVIRKARHLDGSEIAMPMQLEAVIQIFTPASQQYQIWINHERRLIFHVKNLQTNQIQQSSVVDGGWNVARKGISVQMHQPPSLSEEEFNLLTPANQIVREHLYVDLNDQLPELYNSPATLEVYATYSGSDFVSNTIRLELRAE
jgi:exonuclease III